MKYFSNKIINRQNLIDNFLYLKQKSQKDICAVVKANAYGHNAQLVVNILSPFCNFFAVQNLYEAINIRTINKTAIILVLGYCIDYELASKNNISVMIESVSQLNELIKMDIPINIHIKINTGMNRFGLKDKNELKYMQKLIKISKKIKFEGIFTHFYKTDNENITNKQINIFKDYIDIIEKDFSPIIHIGGSKMVNYNVDFANYVRCGISLYGYGEKSLKPVMKIESKVIKIFEIEKGENVGYQNGFIADKKMKIALIPLGYADGIPRNLSNNFKVKICGENVKSIGYICMDLFMVDVSNNNLQIGDKVCVFDNANEWAKKVNITNYEILTNLNNSRTNLLID